MEVSIIPQSARLPFPNFHNFNRHSMIRHLNSARRILKYVISIKRLSINYSGKCSNIKKLRIDGYAHADRVSNLINRMSATRYVFLMYGGPISWISRKQINLDKGSGIFGPVLCLHISQSSLLTRSNCHFPSWTQIIQAPNPLQIASPNKQRSEHIDVRYHFIRHHFDKAVNIHHISGDEENGRHSHKTRRRFKHLSNSVSMHHHYRRILPGCRSCGFNRSPYGRSI